MPSLNDHSDDNKSKPSDYSQADSIFRDIQSKLKELHRLDEVIVELARLGDKTILPLGEYLEGLPEVIPQSRVAAVRVLGLIGTQAASEQLINVLFKYELGRMDPLLAQSEYVVKNAAIEELLKIHPDKPACDFLDAFLRYRLPAAIQAIVKFHILEAVSFLIRALEDDVLAIRAAEALQQLGSDSIPALLQSLNENIIMQGRLESRLTRQRKIYSMVTLAEIGDKSVTPILKKMAREFDPNLAGSAVAALVKLDPSCVSIEEATLLLKATLSPEWLVRDFSREAAIRSGDKGIIAALELFNLNSLPDLYGNPKDISETVKCWLVTYIVENAHSSSFIEALIKNCPQELLSKGLYFVQSSDALPNLIHLSKQRNKGIRRAIAHVLRIMHTEEAVKALVIFLGDINFKTAREARESLSLFPEEMVHKISKNIVPSIKPLWKRLLIKVRLIKI